MSFLLPLLLIAPSAYAWGPTGHATVATIAQMHLEPTVLDRVCTILGKHADEDCYLAQVASWPDEHRSEMPWSKNMHFIGAKGDHPSQSCIFPGAEGWEDPKTNVFHAISNYTNMLQDESRDEADANMALKFIIHFLGDMHQPLHMTGLERGGNLIAVTFGGNQTNLHSVWDDWIIEKTLKTTRSQFGDPLPLSLERHLWSKDGERDIRPFVRRVVKEGLLGRWVDESSTWSTCPSIPSPSLWKQILNFTPFQTWLDLLSRAESSAPDTWDTATVCPYAWAKPIHALNCELVWPQNLTQVVELDVPGYTGVVQEEYIIEKLLAQGGLRLAALLNGIFSH